MIAMSEQPNYYAIIPAEVRYDADLPASAKLLYGEITSLANKNGYCFATNAYFSKLYNVSERQIVRLINALENKGYISMSTRESKNRKIYISCNTSTLTKMSPNPDKNVTVNPDKNVTQNNTSNNKKNNIYTPEFEEWYKRYPNKFNKQQTFKNWKNALKQYSVIDLNTALVNYVRYIQRERVRSEYITRSTNFLGRKGEFIGWLEMDNPPDEVSVGIPEPDPEYQERLRRFGNAD